MLYPNVAALYRGAQSPATRRVGLTSRQAWALEHIVRCSSCGSWVLVTAKELAVETAAQTTLCRHFRVTS